ncbi:MAG: carbohydrate ABC transporter permease [Deltaproteobacteria bacterium]|nr:carbohydrate ABC transporter permease [Deltaproteobacteria bacterium]
MLNRLRHTSADAEGWSERVLRGLALLCVIGFALGPVVWQVITSFKTDAALIRLPPIWPEPWTVENYRAVVGEPTLLMVMWNTVIVAVCSTLCALILGACAAFSLSVLRIRGAQWILAGVLAVSMFPPIATVSPLYLVVRFLGLRDSRLALILLDSTFALPLGIWVMASFFRNIPPEIYAAARVDGCSVTGAFLRVVLPLSAPGLFATAILVFIFAWNEFLLALTMTVTTASRTVPVAIAMFPGLHEIPWGEIAAASIVATTPIALLVFFFQRRIVEGLTVGSVKG